MPSRRRNTRTRRKWQVRKHHSYTVFELADALAVSRATVRRMIGQGLATVDDKRPLLIRGADVNPFLKAKRTDAKRPCGPGRMFCLKCGEPQRPAPDLIEFVWNGASAGNLKGLCEVCGTIMNRRCSAARIPDVMPGLAVTMRRK